MRTFCLYRANHATTAVESAKYPEENRTNYHSRPQDFLAHGQTTTVGSAILIATVIQNFSS